MPFENTFAVFRNILKRKSYNYVCAIDFGTSGTGFCYATPHKGMIDAKRDIIRNPDWYILQSYCEVASLIFCSLY